jgi:hypothetical protein
MDRRTFLANVGVAATWAAVAIRVSGCSEDEGSPTGPGPNGVTGSVTGSDHDHDGAVVTEAQLNAGAAVTLTLTNSGHTHTVGLSAQQVTDIAAGTRVQTTSSNDDGHVHVVTFN